MRLTIVGGGGFRVPLVCRAVLTDPRSPVSDLRLFDVDRRRLAVILAVIEAQHAGHRAQGGRPAVAPRAVDSLDEALRGTDLVFSAVRVGGLAGRVDDERRAMELGLLGQETTGAGGISFALRTVPFALDLARRLARLAPQAWVVNFTNPAGVVTEAMQSELGDRVVGVCDSPAGLVRRALRALEVPAGTPLDVDYAGLNHLGWLRRLVVAGRDVLPGLLADPARLAGIEEGRLFGPGWLAALGALPNEYLYYYYAHAEAVAALREARSSRGELLATQQRRFYAAAAASPTRALPLWEGARREREQTYLAEARLDGGRRDAADLAGGGYEAVALAVMAALCGRAPADPDTGPLILNVRNAGSLGPLPPAAVVEVPCRVGPQGVEPLPIAPLTGHQLGLVAQVKEVEQAVIEAARTRSRRAALRAFGLHPLVRSLTAAGRLAEHATAGWPAP